MIVTILIFLIVLGVLIFVHELGHFLVARAFGIRVDEFAIGFGPKIWSKKVVDKKHGEIVYALNAIPFGGYVKIFGETPDEASISGSDSSRSFVNKPRYAQAAVLFAGVFFNFIFAILVMTIAFMSALPVSVEDYHQYSSRFNDVRVTVNDVSVDSPAQKAGMSMGDTLVSVGGLDRAHMTIPSIQATVEATHGAPIQVTYTSSVFDAGTPSTTVATIVPVQGIVPGHYAIGLDMDTIANLSLPPHLALLEGIKYVGYAMRDMLAGLGGLIDGLFHADKAVLSQVSGPVGIAKIVGQAAHAGIAYLLLLVALISVNLGILNLMPFPALDGGRILFVLIEAVIRRPIKPSVANTINTVGFAILIFLMVVVTYHDIVKLF